MDCRVLPLYYEHLPIPDSKTITEFQKKVYGGTRLIPSGFVTTYGSIAQLIKCKSSQAVGQALKRNPWPIDSKNVDPKCMVPCHRVIGHNGSIGGFSGQRKGVQIDRKLKLLKKEGVRFVLNSPKKEFKLHQTSKHKLIQKFRKIICKVNKK
eukprot:649304_1